MKQTFIFTLLFFAFTFAMANNLQIANTTLVAGNAAGTVLVQFDISWENSWRTDTDAKNWDAVWLFVKYRVNGGDWQHATLSTTAGDHTAPTGAQIETVTDGKGVFMYRNTVGSGTNIWTNTRLQWKHQTDAVATGASIEVKVFGIEMVYVPQGAFYVGDGVSTNTFEGTNDLPVQITTTDVTVRMDGTGVYETDQLGGDATLQSGIKVNGQNGICTTGTGTIDNPNYPTGYKAFYCMKYELSMGQYTDFLNTLTATQAATRFPNYNGQNRHTITGTYPNFTTTTPDRACNYLSWIDGCAYSDWAALRPMTELEYEKACRGTLPAVAYEYAWGSANITSQDYTLTNDGLASEKISNPSTNTGNIISGTTTFGRIIGPARCGILAASATNKTRQETGATFYGIMEMSGNLWERAVTIGNATGRSFTGTTGDGALSTNGNGTNANWPGFSVNEITEATGSGWRGGSWNVSDNAFPTSVRYYAAYTFNDRNNYNGFRCVR